MNELSNKYGLEDDTVHLAEFPKNEKYVEAEEVSFLIRQLIEKYHVDLLGRSIRCLFKKKVKKTVTAKIENDLNRTLYHNDFILIISFNDWKDLSLDEKFSLLDRELSKMNFDINGDKCYLLDPPVQSFPQIVGRWGLATDAEMMLIQNWERFKMENSR